MQVQEVQKNGLAISLDAEKQLNDDKNTEAANPDCSEEKPPTSSSSGNDISQHTSEDLSANGNLIISEKMQEDNNETESDSLSKSDSLLEASNSSCKISYQHASSYWKKVPATVDGMLGGFAYISATDISGSAALLKWIFSQKQKPGHGACVDCGAGIGRITQRLLQRHFGQVDLVEQSSEFIEKAKEIFKGNDKIRNYYCMGLQDFIPAHNTYDVVWTQWVLGYLKDEDLIEFFRRMSASLKSDGVLVVKENFSNENKKDDSDVILDEEDSSVTRPLDLLLSLASAADLNLVRLVQQRKFPKQLFKVYMLVFRPKVYAV